VPGHAVRAGVTSARVGDTVAVPWLGYACGEGKHCLTGRGTLCLKQQNTGYSLDGCYAEYFLAAAAFAARLPVGVNRPSQLVPRATSERQSHD
jgi:alcohol dehydrogenase, propanol-preferring